MEASTGDPIGTGGRHAQYKARQKFFLNWLRKHGGSGGSARGGSGGSASGGSVGSSSASESTSPAAAVLSSTQIRELVHSVVRQGISVPPRVFKSLRVTIQLREEANVMIGRSVRTDGMESLDGHIHWINLLKSCEVQLAPLVLETASEVRGNTFATQSDTHGGEAGCCAGEGCPSGADVGDALDRRGVELSNRFEPFVVSSHLTHPESDVDNADHATHHHIQRGSESGSIELETAALDEFEESLLCQASMCAAFFLRDLGSLMDVAMKPWTELEMADQRCVGVRDVAAASAVSMTCVRQVMRLWNELLLNDLPFITTLYDLIALTQLSPVVRFLIENEKGMTLDRAVYLVSALRARLRDNKIEDLSGVYSDNILAAASKLSVKQVGKVRDMIRDVVTEQPPSDLDRVKHATCSHPSHAAQKLDGGLFHYSPHMSGDWSFERSVFHLLYFDKCIAPSRKQKKNPGLIIPNDIPQAIQKFLSPPAGTVRGMNDLAGWVGQLAIPVWTQQALQHASYFAWERKTWPTAPHDPMEELWLQFGRGGGASVPLAFAVHLQCLSRVCLLAHEKRLRVQYSCGIARLHAQHKASRPLDTDDFEPTRGQEKLLELQVQRFSQISQIAADRCNPALTLEEKWGRAVNDSVTMTPYRIGARVMLEHAENLDSARLYWSDSASLVVHAYNALRIIKPDEMDACPMLDTLLSHYGKLLCRSGVMPTTPGHLYSTFLLSIGYTDANRDRDAIDLKSHANDTSRDVLDSITRCGPNQKLKYHPRAAAANDEQWLEGGSMTAMTECMRQIQLGLSCTAAVDVDVEVVDVVDNVDGIYSQRAAAIQNSVLSDSLFGMNVCASLVILVRWFIQRNAPGTDPVLDSPLATNLVPAFLTNLDEHYQRNSIPEQEQRRQRQPVAVLSCSTFLQQCDRYGVSDTSLPHDRAAVAEDIEEGQGDSEAGSLAIAPEGDGAGSPSQHQQESFRGRMMAVAQLCFLHKIDNLKEREYRWI